MNDTLKYVSFKRVRKFLICLEIHVINKITDSKRKTYMHNKIQPNFYIV